jgi:hypothetical protein
MPVTINEPPALQVNTIITNESCSGCCDGSAQAMVSGGTAGYIFDWSPGTPTGDGTSTISNLCSSSYTCCITDMNGCLICDTAVVSFASGIHDSENTLSFSVYPNPSKGSFRINLPDTGAYSVELSNALGDIVYEGKLNEKENTIDAGLAEGVYFLRLSEIKSGKTANKKIVISN